MALIKEGFRIHYEVLKAESIKSRDNGEYQGFKYPKAVTFRTERLETVETEKFGIDDKEEIMYFVIKCETDGEVIQIKELLRFLDTKKETLHLVGGRPYQKDGDWMVTSTIPASELLKLHNSHKKS